MNGIVLAIVMASVILIVYALLMRSVRGINAKAPQTERHQQGSEENGRRAEEPSLAFTSGNAWLIQKPEPELQPHENGTPPLTNVANVSCCPACGASITENDERCPSCAICFVADGSPKWTPKAVGPADGIYLPPTEVSK
jgi:hypothetical protein